MSAWLARAAAALLVVAAGLAAPSSARAACPDAKTFTGGSFVSDLCWGCIFPISIAGSGRGRTMPENIASPVCTCPSALLMGTPTPGISFGMWKPTHLVETVREPGCFPSIGTEVDLGGVQGLMHGGGRKEDANETGYHSTHVYTFPVSAILDMITSALCTSSSSYDVDLVSISEIDPTHSDAELSMVINPEAVLFANPVAQAVCIADAAAASTYKPLLFAFWCMGSWGNNYPLTGYSNTRSQVQGASLNGTRAVATMHKRGLASLHYGDSAVCSSHPYPTFPKQQYRWQVMYPMPQTNSNDWTGAATILSREWRKVPITGEDWVQVMSTYEECCIHIP
ncbi:TraU family protein [Luteimonas sp. MHLX1A]|uniref:TraU family protein n=1 Tax=Alterluteimonas muca TaxID=2878684 RepID=UPI001E29776C|nr:TraU family protein [Luteimonas sp. MHLX1A]